MKWKRLPAGPRILLEQVGKPGRGQWPGEQGGRVLPEFRRLRAWQVYSHRGPLPSPSLLGTIFQASGSQALPLKNALGMNTDFTFYSHALPPPRATLPPGPSRGSHLPPGALKQTPQSPHPALILFLSSAHSSSDTYLHPRIPGPPRAP